jgi:dihydropyrimidine dehydrogenase (NAD+) subunit PreA
MSIHDQYSNLFLINESARCLLCYSPTCTTACKNGLDPAALIRSVRFENEKNALVNFRTEQCRECAAPCETACIHYDFPIRIKEMADKVRDLAAYKLKAAKEIDLSVNFLGITCENPFFLSSSVIASNYEMCANALKAGWGGIVFKTIGFLQPKEVSPRFDATSKEGTPFVGFRNLEQIAEHTLEENLDYLKRLKEDFPSKVIVASIMGQTEEEWTELAKAVTKIGVDMIECNFSCPHMSAQGLGSDVGQTPELVKRYTEYTRKGTNLPILAKMTPNIGNMEIPALAAIEGGADGIAAINTIKSISRIDLTTMSPPPHIEGNSAVSGYSGKAIKPIALRFIHDMGKHKALKAVPISGMGGIETWRDAAEFIALGCENVQVTTAVMQYGYRIIDDLISGLKGYMKDKGYKNIKDFSGSALPHFVNADKLDRDSVVYPRIDREKCVGCGRCYISCLDAGHQAIQFAGDKRKPVINGKMCVGCHLCLLVCPCGAISKLKRISKPIQSAVS